MRRSFLLFLALCARPALAQTPIAERPTLDVPALDAVVCPAGTTKQTKQAPRTDTRVWCTDADGKRQGRAYTFGTTWVAYVTNVDGIPNGANVLVATSGAVLQRATDRDGVFDGLYESWSDGGGASRGRYRMGERVGQWVVRDPSGKLTVCDYDLPTTEKHCVDDAR